MTPGDIAVYIVMGALIAWALCALIASILRDQYGDDE